MDQDVEVKWEAFKRGLMSASADDSAQWLDEGEIRTLLHDAFSSGIPLEVILACKNACCSRLAFVDHLSGMVGRRRKRILAVDDEPDFLELLRVNFDRTGSYEIRTESDPLLALEAADTFRPDLCIVDLKMPGMDGVEWIAEIRARSQVRNVPVIMLTALLSDTNVDAVTKDNVLHLAKPASWKKLFYCVEAHLESVVRPASGLATNDV